MGNPDTSTIDPQRLDHSKEPYIPARVWGSIDQDAAAIAWTAMFYQSLASTHRGNSIFVTTDPVGELPSSEVSEREQKGHCSQGSRRHAQG
jgi:hypothetical protein